MTTSSNNDLITIVTAFFDIGRGNLQSKEELPDYMTRTNDTYFEYFSNLATLDNPMVIFSDNEHIERIKNIRGNKPTMIIPFNIKKFEKTLKRIQEIQNSEEFISKVRPDLLKNIEYWHPSYVLVNNLKSFFVYKAIRLGLVNTQFVSWVDFGHVRKMETLNHVKTWRYYFNPNKIHLFTIRRKYKINSKYDVYHAIFNNSTFIIGGVIVGTKENWKTFFKNILSTQNHLFRENMIDDDQGVYLLSLFNHKNLYELHYLGKERWFHLFKKFDKTSKISLKEKIKDFFI